MDTGNRLHQAITSALMQLLRPLARLLLRHNIPFGVFEELAKLAYVQVAMAEFGIPGKKPTISRASILSGLTRKDVQRLLMEPLEARSVQDEGYNRAARVLTGWARDPDFQAADGKPLPLPLQDGDKSFAALVRRYSGDMPVRAVLDELLRVGAVHQRDDQLLEMRDRAYVPKHSEIEKLGILGTDVADLIDTIDHNLQHGDTDPRYQRKVMYLSVPATVVPAFRIESASRAQEVLEQLDRWLDERDQPNPNDQPDAPRVRLGLGIYYIEGPAAPSHPKE
jgi:hypothetical protein